MKILIVVAFLLSACGGRRCEFELIDGSIVEAKDCITSSGFRREPICRDRTFSLYMIKSWRCE